MDDPIGELKIRAELLQRQIRRRDPVALVRLRTSRARRSWPGPDIELTGPKVRRRDCLSVLAQELGFSSWPHAKQIISAASEGADFGTGLYPRRCCGHVNLWYSRYVDAAIGHRQSGGYLLGYRHQIVVVQRRFIEDLGLDPDSPEWQRLGFDWVRPKEPTARIRLYGALVRRLPREVRQ